MQSLMSKRFVAGAAVVHSCCMAADPGADAPPSSRRRPGPRAQCHATPPGVCSGNPPAGVLQCSWRAQWLPRVVFLGAQPKARQGRRVQPSGRLAAALWFWARDQSYEDSELQSCSDPAQQPGQHTLCRLEPRRQAHRGSIRRCAHACNGMRCLAHGMCSKT